MMGLQGGHIELHLKANTLHEASIGKDKVKDPDQKIRGNVIVLDEGLPNYPGVLCSKGADSLACPRMDAGHHQTSVSAVVLNCQAEFGPRSSVYSFSLLIYNNFLAFIAFS
jgi:hypothetical protein